MRLYCCLIDLEGDDIFNILKLLDCLVGQPLCVCVRAGVHLSLDLGSCCWRTKNNDTISCLKDNHAGCIRKLLEVIWNATCLKDQCRTDDVVRLLLLALCLFFIEENLPNISRIAWNVIIPLPHDVFSMYYWPREVPESQTDFVLVKREWGKMRMGSWLAAVKDQPRK